MSNHLRYCPKHRKPLPCAHCALAAKSAQTAPVPVELSAEVRRKIEESLATAPSNTAEPKMLVEVETSRGIRAIDANAEPDDAADAVDRTRTRGSGREHKKQPAYLKSVAHPVVPSADREAPFGRDQNDRPILPGRSDQELAADLAGKPQLKPGSCPHQSNPGYCLHCGTANYETTPAEPVDIEDRLRRLFARKREIPKPFDPRFDVDSPFDHFPEILGISRRQLVGLLELPVTETRLSRKKVLKHRADFDHRIAAFERIPRRIEKRKRLIAKSEERIRSWSAHIMKIQVKRGDRNPDDIPEKKDRESWKREERARIERCKTKVAELRQSLSHLDELKRRAATWGEHPEDWEIKVVPEQVEVKFWEKFSPPRNDGKLDPNLTVGGYVALLGEYDLLKGLSRRLTEFPEIDKWRYFENDIVLQAIGFGLFRPTDGALKKYGALTKYVDGNVDEPEKDDPENQLIIKTGGAQIGGSIYSAGWKNGHRRSLESFDKRKPSNGPGEPIEYGGPSSDSWLAGMDSGDLGERAGDE